MKNLLNTLPTAPSPTTTHLIVDMDIIREPFWFFFDEMCVSSSLPAWRSYQLVRMRKIFRFEQRSAQSVYSNLKVVISDVKRPDRIMTLDITGLNAEKLFQQLNGFLGILD